MKVLTHGSNVNFHCSSKEMNFELLHALLLSKKEMSDILGIGILNHEQQQLQLLGDLSDIEIDEEKEIFEFSIIYLDEQENRCVETRRLNTDDFYMSHEAVFDIYDERKGKVAYSVIYLTFWDDNNKEITYFLADLKQVEHPLSCVVQFWEKVREVGRDVDFELTGCTANELKEVRKRMKKN